MTPLAMSFQERGFPDDRQKLDEFILLDPVSPQDVQRSETKSAFNIRKSLAWDSAFFTSAGVLEPEELLQTTSSGATGNAVNLLGNEEEILLPSESLEPERTRKSESYSYRKSLAWDNAFYTSPGVLDPEELSMVNKGFKKSESHQLSAIKEVDKSTECKTTIDSDSSLASLEFDLFEHTRSSRQKPASLKLRRGRCLQNVHSSKKTDASSQKKASDSQRQNLNDRPEWISNKGFVSSKRQLVAGSGKLIPTASLKQPRIFSGLNPSATAATKGSSLGVNCVKRGTAKAGAGKCSNHSENRSLRASSGIATHCSIPFPKSYSSDSLAAKETISESPLNLRRKVDYLLDDFAANGLTISKPSRVTKTNKDELESSSHDSCEMFTPKSTLFASSAATLDGWSSESSSSSSSSMSQRSVSMKSPFGSDGSQASDKVHGVEHENQETSLPNQRMKPSNLRVPSPKNGFFDKEVALVRGQFQSVVPSKVSQDAGENRYGKLNPLRDVDGKKNVQKAFKRENKECTKENEDPNTHCPGENNCIGQGNSDRENAYDFQNQIEGITKQVGIIDLGCDVVMEIKAGKNTFSA